MINKNALESEFNSSMDVLNRINLLFQQCNLNRYNSDYLGWSKCLNILHTELARFVPIADRDDLKKGIVSCFEWTVRNQNKDVPSQLYWKLDSIDTYLRGKFHESGLGIKAKGSENVWDGI